MLLTDYLAFKVTKLHIPQHALLSNDIMLFNRFIIYFKTQYVGEFDKLSDYSMFLLPKYSQHCVHVMMIRQ